MRQTKEKLLETTASARPVATKTAKAETKVAVSASIVADPGSPKASDDSSPRAAQVELPPPTGPPDTLADDLLVGAGAISQFLFGTAGRRRSVYHLSEKGVLPGFKWGGVLVARKSTLREFLAAREREALAGMPAE
jgi:hypothetical protein